MQNFDLGSVHHRLTVCSLFSWQDDNVIKPQSHSSKLSNPQFSSNPSNLCHHSLSLSLRVVDSAQIMRLVRSCVQSLESPRPPSPLSPLYFTQLLTFGDSVHILIVSKLLSLLHCQVNSNYKLAELSLHSPNPFTSPVWQEERVTNILTKSTSVCPISFQLHVFH